MNELPSNTNELSHTSELVAQVGNVEVIILADIEEGPATLAEATATDSEGTTRHVATSFPDHPVSTEPTDYLAWLDDQQEAA